MLGGQVQAAVAGASLPQGSRQAAPSILPLSISTGDLYRSIHGDTALRVRSEIRTQHLAKGVRVLCPLGQSCARKAAKAQLIRKAKSQDP